MEFFFGSSLVLLILCSPILFVIWAIRRIHDLKSQNRVHNNDIASLSDKVLYLEHTVRKLKEEVAQSRQLQQSPTQDQLQGVAKTQDKNRAPLSPQPEPVAANSEGRIDQAAFAEDIVVSASPYGDYNVATANVAGTSELCGDELLLQESDFPANEAAEPAANIHESPGAQSTAVHEEAFADTDIAREFEPVKPRPRPVKQSSGQSWNEMDMESLIGGNLMSKVGALLLVIGLALFLKYSLGSMGPMAKLLAGAILGGGLLAWGSILNRRDPGDVLSLGLIGGGWACLYLTAYAAHGVEATKVVDSPIAGMLLMLLVAAGMICHALRFKSETAVGLAFLLAFASIFVSEVSLYSEIAAVVLTIGMLVLSYHHSWHQLAVAGLLLCYGSMLARLHWRAAPSEVSAMAKLTFVQTLLLVNWATFELISMNFLRRSYGQDEEPTRFVYILNFLFYTAVSLLAWPHKGGPSLSLLAGLIVIQYLLSGALRGFWCQAPGEAAVDKQRFFLGSLEDCLAIASVSSCIWLWYVLPSLGVAIGWALVGLLVIEIAFRAPWQLLRFTGHSIVTAAFLRVFMANMVADGLTMGISYRMLSVVPIVALMAHLYFRTDTEIDWEAAPTGATRVFAPAYSYFGVILVAFLLRFEIGPGLTAPAWAIAALLMNLAANKFKNRHFGRQAMFLVIGAVGYAMSTDLRYGSYMEAEPWVIGATVITSLYLSRWLAINESVQANDSILRVFDVHRKEICSLAGSATFAYLLYVEISGGYLTLAWAAMGIVLLTAGFFVRDRVLRLTGLGTAIVCILKLFLYDARVLDAPFRILAFICLGGALILISWAYSRFKERFEELL